MAMQRRLPAAGRWLRAVRKASHLHRGPGPAGVPIGLPAVLLRPLHCGQWDLRVTAHASLVQLSRLSDLCGGLRGWVLGAQQHSRYVPAVQHPHLPLRSAPCALHAQCRHTVPALCPSSPACQQRILCRWYLLDALRPRVRGERGESNGLPALRLHRVRSWILCQLSLPDPTGTPCASHLPPLPFPRHSPKQAVAGQNLRAALHHQLPNGVDANGPPVQPDVRPLQRNRVSRRLLWAL